MSAFLGKHIAQQISISETDITQILTYFKPHVYEKKACLLQENLLYTTKI